MVELMIQVRGPLVRSLDVVFATDWWQEPTPMTCCRT